MTVKAFEIIPAARRTYLVVAALIIVILVPFIPFYMVWHTPAGLWIGVFSLALSVLLAVGLVVAAYSAGRSRVIVTEDGLTIKTFLYGRTVKKNALCHDNAKIFDLQNERRLAPTIRTNGIGLPGFQTGWFRLADKQKALLVVTDKSRIVYLPTVKGYSMLLSVAQPQEFIKTAQELWKDEQKYL